MNDMQDTIKNLSPQKRQLFEMRLKARRSQPHVQTIPRRELFSPAPLSFAQQRLWFLNELEPDNPTYNIPMALGLEGQLQIEILEQALNAIVQRHEALRTTFDQSEDEAVQLIASSQALRLPLVDLSDLGEADRRLQLKKLASEEARRLFDLKCGPLVRCTLVRLACEEHVLLLTMHHIVSDGWSIGVLIKELAALYEAFLSGKASPLPPLPIQYADFALWQRQWLTGEALEEQVRYWKKQMAGAPAVLVLATDHPRPAVQSSRGASLDQLLPQSLAQSLHSLSRQEKTTLFVILLAAFQTLLHRYSGQEDMVIGSPIANRNRTEIEDLIGFFVNTLLLRADFSKNPTFKELLAQVHEVTLGAYAHQDLPFEKLVEVLHPQRDLSHSPLFQVMFALQNAPAPPLKIGNLALSFLPTDHGMAIFDLTLFMFETEQGLLARLEYNTDLFDEATMRRFLGHYQRLLEEVVLDPGQEISRLPLVTQAEARQLVEWNRTEADYPQESCLHQLVEKQAGLTPDRIAVEFEGHFLTYSQLNDRANQLAHYLQKRGVGPDVLVGLFVERSLDMVVGVLGILKAGGAYVPLDPDYPKERLAFMLADSRAAAVVTQESLKDLLPPLTGLVCLDTDRLKIQQEQPGNSDCGVSAENLCYVIFTSGSTGKPKGVLLTHRNAVNVLTSICREPGFSAEDTMLAVTTLSFDISVAELFLPLKTGGRLVIVSREVASDGLKLLHALEVSQATFMQPTPVTWRLLLEAGWRGSPQLKMISTGEPLPRELANQLLPKGASLWNLYGPTETTIWSTGCRVESTEGPVLIGRPLANTQLYILDAQRQPVPLGVPGELYIGGDGVARGYLNRPDLTVERFITHPFRPEQEKLLYRTGDLVRYRADGFVECLGRMDHQVKIRGYRMELGEIEKALEGREDIGQAVVVVRELEPGNKQLVAYVVPKGETGPEVRELKERLRKSLPEYMVPASFMYLEQLPLTPNGKVDRRALGKLEHAGLESPSEYVAPRNEMESRLAELWQQVLGAKAISVTSNFFDEGGHSLLAARLLAQIERTFRRKMSLAAFFKYPTIESFAKRLQDESGCVPSEQVHAIQPKGSKTPLFIVTSQPPIYRSLAARLGSDQPIFGLTSPEWSALPEKFTLQDIAANLLEALCHAQPHGPYCLAGWCMSGVIAYDMAQKLRSRGEEVALLAIFDGLCPEYRRQFMGLKGISARCYFIYRVWLFRIKKILLMRPVELLRYAWKGIQTLKKDRRGNWRRFLPFAGRPVDPGAELQRFGNLEVDASRAYEPHPYDSRGVVFISQVTRNELGRYYDPHLGWKPFIQAGLESLELPGDHEAMFHEPGVGMLAEKLNKCLQEAGTAAAGMTLSKLASR